MNEGLKQTPLESLWTPVEVAAYLKVSRSWIYQHAEAGLLPCLRVGGLLRFEPQVIRAHVRGESVRSNVVPFTKRS